MLHYLYKVFKHKEVSAMFYVSEIFTTAPDTFTTPLQRRAYRAPEKLSIPFERVETDEAITMEDCVLINQKLNMKMVKTLFLCNKQQTDFYLFVTTGDKRFNSADFCAALNIPRVSFAPAKLMEEILGAKIGAATVFSALRDADNEVHIIIDKDVAQEEWYGCSDGTTTGYMKISTVDVLERLLPYADHTPEIINI